MIWKFILVQVLATQEIQDGVQDGRRFFDNQCEIFSQAQKFYLQWLKGGLSDLFISYLSAIY